MKTLKLSTITIALALFCVFSCKKDSSTSSSATTVTTDDAADVAAGALSENSNGLASVTDDISSNAAVVASIGSGQTINSAGVTSEHQACGTTVADSASNSGSADSVTWNYFRKYTHTLNCNASNQPDNIVNTLVYSGNYSGPRISSNNSGTANVTIAGLTTNATNYVLNGEYKRTGSFTNKVSNKAFSSNIDIVGTNILLSKPGRKIIGGTATISISGTTPKGTFSYTGTITFNADSTATLVITGGGTYTIDLHTGFKVKH